MTHRNLKSLYFIGAFFLALALYWPSINGTPIWDDQSFWFNDQVMYPDFPYLTIWKNFAWPFSVSFQKFTLSLFDKKYFVYHLINIILHFLQAGSPASNQIPQISFHSFSTAPFGRYHDCMDGSG
jgi:hypothetical protein